MDVMAKKKHKKKHNFKHQSAAATATPAVSSGRSAAEGVAATTSKSTSVANQFNEWPIVRGDVQRVLVLAVVFIAFELVLAYVFNHTSLGSQLYSSIKL